MENTKKPDEFTIGQYRVICADIAAKVVEYQKKLMCDLLPKSKANKDTLYYLSLLAATRAICVIVNDEKHAKKGLSKEFCKNLSKMVAEARLVIVIDTQNDKVENKH